VSSQRPHLAGLLKVVEARCDATLARRLEVVAGVSFASFVALSVAVMLGKTIALDFLLRAAVHQQASSAATGFAIFCSFLGSTAWLAGLTLVLAGTLYLLGWRRLAARILIAMAGAVALNNMMKYAFQRPRPLPFFGIAPESFSYPSGHALYATTFYTIAAAALIMLVQSGRMQFAIVLAGALVLLVGWSRIYLGVHYPSDVIGGILLGISWLAVWFRTGMPPLNSGTERSRNRA
jgi:undecaprenyl-diphosphatase